MRTAVGSHSAIPISSPETFDVLDANRLTAFLTREAYTLGIPERNPKKRRGCTGSPSRRRVSTWSR
ncbi:MAG: hypothetical protein ACXVRS_14905 [Gaiellaceae bacterium]